VEEGGDRLGRLFIPSTQRLKGGFLRKRKREGE